jgi:hypothetical protein
MKIYSITTNEKITTLNLNRDVLQSPVDFQIVYTTSNYGIDRPLVFNVFALYSEDAENTIYIILFDSIEVLRMTIPIDYTRPAQIVNLNVDMDFFLAYGFGPINPNMSEKLLLEFAKLIATMFEIKELDLIKGITYYM